MRDVVGKRSRRKDDSDPLLLHVRSAPSVNFIERFLDGDGRWSSHTGDLAIGLAVDLLITFLVLHHVNEMDADDRHAVLVEDGEVRSWVNDLEGDPAPLFE